MNIQRASSQPSAKGPADLAEAITKDVMSVLHYGEESVSVAIEEVPSNDRAEKVYRPDIVSNPQTRSLLTCIALQCI